MTTNVLQEMFDLSVNHLRAQGERSIEDGACRYRMTAEDGRTLMCAAGPLIPDALYSPDLENQPIGQIWEFAADDKWGTAPPVIALAQELQHIHDNCYPTVWEARWGALAGRYNLVYTPPVTEG